MAIPKVKAANKAGLTTLENQALEESTKSRRTKGVEIMTPQMEFMKLFIKTAEEHCNLDTGISLQELPDENSLYAELGSVFTDTTYYDKSALWTFPVRLLCQNTDPCRCLEQLSDICNYYQRLKEYPQGETFAWLDTVTVKETGKINRDENGMYHYSCILNCKVYF